MPYVDWTRANSVAEPWDDGHVPEGLLSSSSSSVQQHQQQQQQQQQPCCIMRRYPRYHPLPHHMCPNSSPPCFCRVVSDAAPETLAHAVYQYTTSNADADADTDGNTNSNTTCKKNTATTTWGSYVTLSQIRAYWKQQHQHQQQQQTQKTLEQQDHLLHLHLDQDDLALRAAAVFLEQVNHILRHDNGNCGDQEEDKEEYHGIAVWALAADVGSRVPYHMDYAELLRYETGTIVPPVVAGTWHVTETAVAATAAAVDATTTTTRTTTTQPNNNPMRGGEFGVVTADPWEHYRRFGYKGALGRDEDECYREGSIQIIPYCFNQMIVMSGHLPHWSTRVLEIGNGNNKSNPLKRVVVGFNIFLSDVGPFVQEAPEHSEPFRQRVQRMRTTLAQQQPQQPLSLQCLKSHPALRRCLVLAKRERVKQEYQHELHHLDQQIQEYLSGTNNNGSSTATTTTTNASGDEITEHPRVRVQDLVERFQATTTLDVHGHIHRRWKDGRWRCFLAESDVGEHEKNRCSNSNNNNIENNNTTTRRSTLVPAHWWVMEWPTSDPPLDE